MWGNIRTIVFMQYMSTVWVSYFLESATCYHDRRGFPKGSIQYPSALRPLPLCILCLRVPRISVILAVVADVWSASVLVLSISSMASPSVQVPCLVDNESDTWLELDRFTCVWILLVFCIVYWLCDRDDNRGRLKTPCMRFRINLCSFETMGAGEVYLLSPKTCTAECCFLNLFYNLYLWAVAVLCNSRLITFGILRAWNIIWCWFSYPDFMFVCTFLRLISGSVWL